MPVGVGLDDRRNDRAVVLTLKVVAYVIGLVGTVGVYVVSPLVSVVVALLDSIEVVGHAVAHCAKLGVVDVTDVLG